MTTDQLLNTIAERGLLTAEQVARVRTQVANSVSPVSPKALAKHLVEKGLLTVGQAQSLLAAAAPPAAAVKAKPAPRPDAGKMGPDSREHSLLEELPLEELPLEELPLEELPLAELPLEELPLEELPLEEVPPVAPAQVAKKPAANSVAKPLAPAVAPAASSLLDELDELAGSSPLAGSPLDLLSGSAGLGAEGSPLLAPPRKKGLKGLFGSSEPRKKRPGESEFDSPLMLFGGGGLALLLIVGGLVYFLYARGSGDEQFKLAEDEYRAGAYSQALAKYDEYLKKYPTHPSASMAKVHRGLARLRQATERTNDYSHALEVAQSVVNEIAGEKEFGEAKAEFRSLFPDIAEGLAKEATAQKEPAAVKAKLAEAEKALALVMNTSYVPKSQQPLQRIGAIRELMAVATRDLDRDQELASTIDSMRQATERQEIAAAYSLRKKLLKAYPELETSEALGAAVQAVASGEKEAVQVADGGQEAESAEATSAVLSQTALATWLLKGESSGPVVPLLVAGAVFAFDSGSGELRWRRYVGHDSPAPPLAIGPQAEADLLLIDAATNELVRLASKTGKLVWRQALGERAAGVAILGKQAVVSTRAGKLVAVDLQSGKLLRTARLPQVTRLAAAANSSAGRLYQVGDQSSVYVLGGDLACQQAYYLGHETGTVALPPLVLAKHLIIVENRGVQSAILHVLAIADDGKITGTPQKIDLPGHVLTPPVLADRKLVVMTDLGHIKVMGVNPSNLEAPLADLANQPPASNSGHAVRQLLVEESNLWIADNRLMRYKVQSAAGRLAPSPLEDDYDGLAFEGPLQIAGKLLIHARRVQEQPGVRVCGTRASDGSRQWETVIAAPLVAGPIATDANTLLAATRGGELFPLNAKRLSEPVAGELASAQPSANGATALAWQQELGARAIAIAPAAGGNSLLIARPGANAGWQSLWIKLPEALACAPAKLGKGIAVPTRVGQVFWLNPATGKPVAAPFQPQVTAGSDVKWTNPDATADGKELIISDGPRVYRIGLARDPAPHLESRATSEDLAEPIVTPVAVLGELAFAANSADQLLTFRLKDLSSAEPQELGAAAVWGPKRIGQHVLLSTAADELLCLNSEGKIVWRQSLELGPLAGDPTLVANTFLLTMLDGHVVRLASEDGSTAASGNLGQPLGTGAVPMGDDWIVATADGTLLRFPSPVADATDDSKESAP